MASDRRARKRERKERGDEEAFEAAFRAYLWTRIVCDKCGLEQPFRANVWEGYSEQMAPCEGPLGMTCDSETAVFADTWDYWHPAP